MREVILPVGDIENFVPESNTIYRAEVDGATIIRGGLVVREKDNILFEGIRVFGSSRHAIEVKDSSRINLSRVSAYNGSGSGNFHIISYWRCNDCELVDVVASGTGRKPFDFLQCEAIEGLRLFGRWKKHEGGGGPNESMTIYGSSFCTVKNSIFAPVAKDQSQGIAIWANSGMTCVDNTLIGNLVYGAPHWGMIVAAKTSAGGKTTGSHLEDNTIIGCHYGLLNRVDQTLVVKNQTIVDTTGYNVVDYRHDVSTDRIGAIPFNTTVDLSHLEHFPMYERIKTEMGYDLADIPGLENIGSGGHTNPVPKPTPEPEPEPVDPNLVYVQHRTADDMILLTWPYGDLSLTVTRDQAVLLKSALHDGITTVDMNGKRAQLAKLEEQVRQLKIELGLL